MTELIELLEAAGHSDFRDARGPMGFTQRQAGGKFTRAEADAFIEQLQNEADSNQHSSDSAGSDPDRTPKKTDAAAPPRRSTMPAAATGAPSSLTPAEKQLRQIPTAELAAELQRRGWIVVEP